MKQRCLNPRDKKFQDYGGRGITICPEWRDSFVRFIADVGVKASAGVTLDRIDNDRGYEPGNVRWTTYHEQNMNRRPRSHYPPRGPRGHFVRTSCAAGTDQ